MRNISPFFFQGIGLCEKYISTCEQLTTLYWPNFVTHRWEGGPYKPEHAINVHNRFVEKRMYLLPTVFNIGYGTQTNAGYGKS